MDQNKKPSLPHGWEVLQSTSIPSRVYYHNKYTGVSTWHLNQVLPSSKLQHRKSSDRYRSDGSSEKSPKLVPPYKKNSEDASRSKSSKRFGVSTSSRRKMKGTTRYHPYSSIPSSPPSSNRREESISDSEMDVDDLSPIDQDEIMSDISNFRQDVQNLTNTNILTPPMSYQEEKIPQALKTLNVIVDTNIFISKLKLLDEISQRCTDNKIRILFIVPWIVLQELEKMKTGLNKKIKPLLYKQADIANKYIRKRLNSPNSFFRGQTVAQATAASNFRAMSNDDQILQCAMQYSQNANDSTILFSNDTNLLCKAEVNSIGAYNCEEIKSGLSQAINALLAKDFMTKVDKDLPVYDSEKLDKHSTVKDYFLDVSITLEDALGVVLETEMRAEYDLKWFDIVKIKPPWRLLDVLNCIDKHWYAVFGFFIPKLFQNTVKKLKNIFNVKNEKDYLPEELRQIIDECISLLMQFEYHSPYDGKINEAILALGKLSTGLEKLENSPKSTLTERDVFQQKPDCHDDEKVTKMFQEIWRSVQISTAKLCDIFQIEHNINYPKSALPSLQTAVDHLSRLYPEVNQICEKMSRVAASKKVTDIDSLFKTLLFYFSGFDQGEVDFDVSTKMFQQFCLNDSNRQRIKSGLEQLNDYRLKLQECCSISKA